MADKQKNKKEKEETKKSETSVKEKGKVKAKAQSKSAGGDPAKLRLELRNLMLDLRTGKESDTSKVKSLKKQIARALTAQNMKTK